MDMFSPPPNVRALDRPADRSRDGANGGGARFLVFRARAAIARVKLRKVGVSLPVFLRTRREDTTSVANASGNATLSGPARIGGLLAPAGMMVDSSIDVWSITGEIAYSIFTPFRDRRFAWSDPVDRSKGNRTSDGRPIIDLRLEVLFGTRFLNLEQEYELAGVGTVSTNNTWVSPYLGVGIELDWDSRESLGFLNRIEFDVTAGWGPAFGGGNSSLTIRVDGAFYVTRDLALTLGYRLNDFDLEREETAFNGGLQGLFAGVRYTW